MSEKLKLVKIAIDLVCGLKWGQLPYFLGLY